VERERVKAEAAEEALVKAQRELADTREGDASLAVQLTRVEDLCRALQTEKAALLNQAWALA
jgi:hypothetical protein